MPVQWTISQPHRLVIAVASDELRLADVEEYLDGITVANAGALTFRLTVHGRAAHGSVRHEGVSAVNALYPLLPAIDALEERRNRTPDALFADLACPYPISIGVVHAGDWPLDLVADEAGVIKSKK